MALSFRGDRQWEDLQLLKRVLKILHSYHTTSGTGLTVNKAKSVLDTPKQVPANSSAAELFFGLAFAQDRSLRLHFLTVKNVICIPDIGLPAQGPPHLVWTSIPRSRISPNYSSTHVS